MTTESFKLTDMNEKDIGYMHLDRNYTYGGIMIIDDDAFPETAGVCGCTYFEEFDEIICKWAIATNHDNETLKFYVNTDVARDINRCIKEDVMDTIFYIDIKDGKIAKVYTDNFDITNNEILEEPVGKFGMIFDYYTDIITENIQAFRNEEEIDIWGVYIEDWAH